MWSASRSSTLAYLARLSTLLWPAAPALWLADEVGMWLSADSLKPIVSCNPGIGVGMSLIRSYECALYAVEQID